MGRACITNGAKMHIVYWWVSQKERDYYEDEDIGGCIIWDGMVWTGSIWLRIGTGGRLL
jgi:hypothetical protein